MGAAFALNNQPLRCPDSPTRPHPRLRPPRNFVGIERFQDAWDWGLGFRVEGLGLFKVF